MKVRVYVLGGFLGGLLAFGPVAMAQGDTSGPAAGGNVAPQTGVGAGGATGMAGPRGSENGPTPHVRTHSRRSRARHMSNSGRMSNPGNMSNSGGTSGPAAGGNVAPQTGVGAGGATGMAGPRGSENGPTPQPGSSNSQ